MTKLVQTDTDFGTQREDMEAINVWMRTTPIVNNSAYAIKDDFIRWYDMLSLWDRTLSQAAYDEARTRRNKFNLANVKSEAERKNIQDVIMTGITTEEMQGKERPATLSSGEVGKQVTNPTVSGTMAPGGRPTIRQGIGTKDPKIVAAVKEWQTIIGVSADGNFGPGTKAATVAWQKKNGLTADGIVGPATWSKALSPSGAGPSSSPPTLSKGSRGSDVTKWQTIVGVKPATGVFGDSTVAQTKLFQSRNGLPVTGVVDSRTWAVGLRGGFVPATSPQPVASKPIAPKPPAAPKPTTVASKPTTSKPDSTKPVAAAKPTVTTKAKEVAVAQASMFDFTKWPTPVKVILGVGAAIGIAVNLAMGKKLKG
jgi:peptidoglycan hydrolase-like protein with peptidoglycan-binding domain